MSRSQAAASTGSGTRVADLVPGSEARGVYAVKKKVCREQPGGSLFLLFQFSDRTGVINGVLWDGAATTQHEVAAGDLVHVQGEVQLYQNTRQIKVRQIVRADPAGFDLSEFLPTSTQDLDVLYARLLATIESVRDPWLRRLYADIFGDPELAPSFKHAPAGKGWHHAYVGGLLEHVVSMLEIGDLVARQHAELDRDLMIGGILLHDIGKVDEMALRSHIEYTDPGRLVGHLVQGCLRVGRAMDRIEGFPAEQRMRLLHTIVSHHGSLDRGSPKPPMTLEAVVVHLIDTLDSQVQAVEQVVKRAETPDGWSEHVKLLDRFFYTGAIAPAEGRGDSALPSDPA
jgi:3'-5' exoribonuclease